MNQLTIEAPYGWCPICGSKGKTRERRPNGNDSCVSGHEYPSKDAITSKARLPDPFQAAYNLQNKLDLAISTLERCKLGRIDNAKEDLNWMLPLITSTLSTLKNAN